MQKQINQVTEFHETYGHPVATSIGIPNNRREMRLGLIEEEVAELREASERGDVVETLDALGDILYVVIGFAIECGLADKLEPAVDEIHASNMSKLGADGKPMYREDGKVLKGPNYFRPNLHQFVED